MPFGFVVAKDLLRLSPFIRLNPRQISFRFQLISGAEDLSQGVIRGGSEGLQRLGRGAVGFSLVLSYTRPAAVAKSLARILY